MAEQFHSSAFEGGENWKYNLALAVHHILCLAKAPFGFHLFPTLKRGAMNLLELISLIGEFDFYEKV